MDELRRELEEEIRALKTRMGQIEDQIRIILEHLSRAQRAGGANGPASVEVTRASGIEPEESTIVNETAGGPLTSAPAEGLDQKTKDLEQELENLRKRLFDLEQRMKTLKGPPSGGAGLEDLERRLEEAERAANRADERSMDNEGRLLDLEQRMTKEETITKQHDAQIAGLDERAD